MLRRTTPSEPRARVARHRPLAAFAPLSCAALLLAALASGCAQRAAPVAAPANVIAATPQNVTLSDTSSYAGEVRARFETPLAFRVAGQLAARPAHLGDAVHQGQVLATLDSGDSTAALAAARAAVAAAQQRLDLARLTHDRNARESQEDLISQAQHEQSDSQLAVATSDLEQAQAQLALAQNQSRYTTLVAPHDGIIMSEDAEVGAVLAAGAPVFGFAWSGERDVIIEVPEQRIAAVHAGQKAQVTLWSDPKPTLRATVRDVAQSSDPQSRTFRVKLALDASAARLPVGLTAAVVLDDPKAVDPLRIPATALFHDGEHSAVWVITPGKHALELRRVEIALYGENDVFIASGLAATDQIVAQGVHTVTAGQIVTPMSDATGTGSATTAATQHS